MKKCEFCGKEISYFDMYCQDECQENANKFYDLRDKVCDEMLEYMSEILNINFVENDLLVNSLKAFLPASFIRTK